MFLFVDTAIVLLVIGLVRSGWRRGFVSYAIDLVGFTAALLLSVRYFGWPAAAWRLGGLSDRWAALAGGLTIFVPFIIAVGAIGWRAGKVALVPGLRTTNRFLGAGFGALWAAVVLTFVLLVAHLLPLPDGVTGAIRRSPVAGFLLRTAEPATGFVERYAAGDARRLVAVLRDEIEAFGSPEVTPSPENSK